MGSGNQLDDHPSQFDGRSSSRDSDGPYSVGPSELFDSGRDGVVSAVAKSYIRPLLNRAGKRDVDGLATLSGLDDLYILSVFSSLLGLAISISLMKDSLRCLFDAIFV